MVYSYSASHGLLLFRSRKQAKDGTRIDVLIQDVRAMELRCWFDGFTIEEASPDAVSGFRSNPREMVEAGNSVYILRGNGWQGFVVGGLLSVHEDVGEYGDPSALLGS